MKFWFIQTIKTSSNIDFSIVLLFLLYKSVNFNHFLLLWHNSINTICRVFYYSFFIFWDLSTYLSTKRIKRSLSNFTYPCLSLLTRQILLICCISYQIQRNILVGYAHLLYYVCFNYGCFFELCFWSVSAICNLMTYRLRSLTYDMPFTLYNLRCATYVL